MNTQELREITQARTDLNARIEGMFVNELDLPIEPGQIDSDQPLLGRGLELDSLDTLEIVSAIEEAFAVYLADDNRHIFGSANRLADKIEAQSWMRSHSPRARRPQALGKNPRKPFP